MIKWRDVVIALKLLKAAPTAGLCHDSDRELGYE
jgi:hypothetical protein